MKCTQCGKEIDAGAAFCGNCGAPTQNAMTQPQPMATVPQPQPPLVPNVPQPQYQVPGVPPAPQPQQIQPAVVPAAPMAQPLAQPTVSPVPVAAPQQQPGQAGMPQATVPAYAIAQPGQTTARPVVGLVLGILSLPAAFIPIFGVGFGIAAIILGSTSLKKRHGLALASLILGIVGVVVGLLAWALFAKAIQNANTAGAAGALYLTIFH